MTWRYVVTFVEFWKPQKEAMFMRVRTSVSFEYDLKPVETVRADFEAPDFEAAFKTAVFRARKQYPRAKPRSMVAVIEELAVEAVDPGREDRDEVATQP